MITRAADDRCCGHNVDWPLGLVACVTVASQAFKQMSELGVQVFPSPLYRGGISLDPFVEIVLEGRLQLVQECEKTLVLRMPLRIFCGHNG
jgi:hypothetical protein